MARSSVVALLLTLLFSSACSKGARGYELRGQVLAVDKERQEITVKHEDIVGFMPGMTMPFRVEDRSEFEARVPGELIRATLVVTDRGAHLEDVTKTGEAPLTNPPPAVKKFDLLEPGDFVPDEPFVDQNGVSRRLSDWKGKAVAVTFIYTRCPLPDFCPRMDQNFAVVRKEAASDPVLRDRVQLLSVSFDPEHDTPAVLKKHAARSGTDGRGWSFVTGTPEDIERFASRFGVSLFREDQSGQEIVHNLRTAVIDPERRLVRVFGGNDWTPSVLLDALRTALGAR